MKIVVYGENSFFLFDCPFKLALGESIDLSDIDVLEVSESGISKVYVPQFINVQKSLIVFDKAIGFVQLVGTCENDMENADVAFSLYRHHLKTNLCK